MPKLGGGAAFIVIVPWTVVASVFGKVAVKVKSSEFGSVPTGRGAPRACKAKKGIARMIAVKYILMRGFVAAREIK